MLGTLLATAALMKSAEEGSPDEVYEMFCLTAKRDLRRLQEQVGNHTISPPYDEDLLKDGWVCFRREGGILQ